MVLTLLVVLSLTCFAYAESIEQVEKMIVNQQYVQAIQLAKSMFVPEKPKATVLSVLAKAYYGLGDSQTQKKVRLKTFEEGMDFIEPYVDTAIGTKRERAFLAYWYAVYNSKCAEEKGAINSLWNVPKLVKLCDKAIAIDPTLGHSYFLKGMVYKNVPIGQYSDKFLMAVNLSAALKNDPNNIFFMVEFADALKSRNWQVDTKKDHARKKNLENDGTPMNLSDWEYALQLVNKAIAIYNQLDKPDNEAKDVYAKAKELLVELKK